MVVVLPSVSDAPRVLAERPPTGNRLGQFAPMSLLVERQGWPGSRVQ